MNLPLCLISLKFFVLLSVAGSTGAFFFSIFPRQFQHSFYPPNSNQKESERMGMVPFPNTPNLSIEPDPTNIADALHFQHSAILAENSTSTDDGNRLWNLPPFFIIRHFFPSSIWNKDLKKYSSENESASNINKGRDEKEQNRNVSLVNESNNTMNQQTELTRRQVMSTISPVYPNGRNKVSAPHSEKIQHLSYNSRETKSNNPFKLFPILHAHFSRLRSFHPIYIGARKISKEESSKENGTSEKNIRQTESNETENASNDIKSNTRNCSYTRFFSHYLFVSNIKWTSLGVHLLIILLLSLFVTSAMLYCCPHLAEQRLKVKFYKSKQMNV